MTQQTPKGSEGKSQNWVFQLLLTVLFFYKLARSFFRQLTEKPYANSEEKRSLKKNVELQISFPYKNTFRISYFQEQFATGSTTGKTMDNTSFSSSSMSRLQKPYANFFETNVANPRNHLTPCALLNGFDNFPFLSDLLISTKDFNFRAGCEKGPGCVAKFLRMSSFKFDHIREHEFSAMN